MKRAVIGRLALVTVAIALSLAVFTRDGVRNVSPCDMVPGCVSAPDSHVAGTFITMRNGFPVAYRETQIFQPTKGATYKEARLSQEGVKISAIILDVIFWYALLELLFRIRATVRTAFRPNAPDKPAAETVAKKA